MYKQNKIDFIWSEDSDILVYDCKNIIKGLKLEGDCQILDQKIFKQFKANVSKGKNIEDATKKKKAIKFIGLSPEEKIHVAVYSGCDYLDNVKGLGFGTVIDYFPNK